jgi:hypothetical protein
VPWSLALRPKTAYNRLLDIMSRIPEIIQGSDEVLAERAQWVARDYCIPAIRKEKPSTVPDLQRQLVEVSSDLAQWRLDWETTNAPTASGILDWVLQRAKYDSYRPGINNAHGPDVYELAMSDAARSRLSDPVVGRLSPRGVHSRNDADTFGLMQDAATYTTVLIWVDRLRKNLDGAAQAPDAVDFYNTPFYTRCRCYYDKPGLSRQCQVFPDPTKSMNASMSWNLGTVKVAECPAAWSHVDTTGPRIRLKPQQNGRSSTKSNVHSEQSTVHLDDTLLPGDVRFAGQLRILNWLIQHLPHSRSYVLGTLAAMGLGHCVHDVRPLEGHELVADAIRKTMARSQFGVAADLLLRAYR